MLKVPIGSKLSKVLPQPIDIRRTIEPNQQNTGLEKNEIKDVRSTCKPRETAYIAQTKMVVKGR